MKRTPIRLTDGQRVGARAGGAALVLVGGLLVYRVMATPLSPGPAGMGGGPGPGSFMLGGVLVMAGIFLLRLGFMGAYSEIAATEMEGAVHTVAHTAGRGLRDAGIGGAPREVVRVRCRGCGYLESEDARYCSSCRTEMA